MANILGRLSKVPSGMSAAHQTIKSTIRLNSQHSPHKTTKRAKKIKVVMEHLYHHMISLKKHSIHR